jgi:hypothetical protein
MKTVIHKITTTLKPKENNVTSCYTRCLGRSRDDRENMLFPEGQKEGIDPGEACDGITL